MGFFDELFNKSAEQEEEISLGRFSDAYKPEDQFNLWEASLLAYENEDYLKSAMLLFDFLKNPKAENISYTEEEGAIKFQFFQGSKVISGYLDQDKFRSEVRIAKANEMNIGLSRRLLEKNYLLKHSRFAVDENGCILLIFDSYTLDASPNKLYQGLKEMSTQADKLDDLILDEFRDLRPINQEHILPRNDAQKEKQYVYLLNELKACFHEIDNGKLNIDQFPGGLSFLILAMNYKLDYLLTPEGFLMDTLEQNHRVFFANDGREASYRNNQVIKSFRKVLDREKEEVKAEFYDVISTFGLPNATPHETLANLIQSELEKMQWYKENNHTAVALAIPSYIVGYSLFTYALPKPDMKLLTLFFKVTESAFLNEGAFISKGLPIPKKVKREVENIEQKYKPLYPHLNIDSSAIDFSNMVSFSESYLNLIKNINLDQN